MSAKSVTLVYGIPIKSSVLSKFYNKDDYMNILEHELKEYGFTAHELPGNNVIDNLIIIGVEIGSSNLYYEAQMDKDSTDVNESTPGSIMGVSRNKEKYIWKYDPGLFTRIRFFDDVTVEMNVDRLLEYLNVSIDTSSYMSIYIVGKC